MGRIGDESERLAGLVNEMLQVAREAPLTDQIMERHHGTATVGATPGGGATFTLALPLATRADSHRATAGGR